MEAAGTSRRWSASHQTARCNNAGGMMCETVHSGSDLGSVLV